MNASIQCPTCLEFVELDCTKAGHLAHCSVCNQAFDVPSSFAAECITPPPIQLPPRPRKVNKDEEISSPSMPFAAWILACALLAMALTAAVAVAVGRRPASDATAESTHLRPTHSMEMPEQSPVLVPSKSVDGREFDEKDPVGKSGWTELIQNANRSVVMLKYVTHDGIGTGTGFFVRDNQTIVTNYHVVRGATLMVATLHDGQNIAVAGYLVFVPGEDLAVLKLETAAPGNEPIPLATVLPLTGERVIALGAPHGLAGSASDGIVSGVRHGSDIDVASHSRYSHETIYSAGTEWVQTTAPISPGNSGGPLLNVDGMVVGVNTFAWADSQNLNFAVSSQHIVKLLITLPDVVRPLASLPKPAKSRADVDADRAAEERIEAERVLLAKVEADRKRVLDAIESAKLSQERQALLQRISDQILQIRSELSRVELEGTALTTRRDEVMARGKAVFVVGSGIARRSTAALTQLAYLEGCVRRRQAVVNGLVAVLDDHPAPYNVVGLAQVRGDYSLKEIEVSSLRTEATVAEATFVQLDQEARSLLIQIEYKANEREQKRQELRRLADEQAKLKAALP